MRDETIEAFTKLKAELEIPYIYRLNIHESNPFIDPKIIIDWRQWNEIANDGYEAILQSKHVSVIANGSYEEVKQLVETKIRELPIPLKELDIDWRRINNSYATQIKLLLKIKPNPRRADAIAP